LKGLRAKSPFSHKSPTTPARSSEGLAAGCAARGTQQRRWQAERAIGDHDRNMLRLRVDPQGDTMGFKPGVKVWLDR